MVGVFVSKTEICSLGDHSRGILQTCVLGDMASMGFRCSSHHQVRLWNGTVLERSGKGLLAGALDKKMQNDIGERSVQGMAVTLPIAALAVHLDIAGLLAAIFKMDHGSFEVRPGLAIPLSEMEDFKCLAVRRFPLCAVFAVVESGLYFELPLPHDGFTEVVERPGRLIAGGEKLFHSSG